MLKVKRCLARVAATVFVLLSLCACSESKPSSSASSVTVTSSKIRLLPDTSQPIRLEVGVELVITNNGERPIEFDAIVGEFFINDSRVSAARSSLGRPRAVGPGEEVLETIESMASNFGLSSVPEIERRVEVSLLREGAVVYGPFSIAVPRDLRP